MLAIIAKHKIGHGLVSALNLDLNETGLVTLAFLTLEHAFVVALTLDDFLLPVCSFVVHASHHRFFSLLLHGFRGMLARIHAHEVFRRDIHVQDREEGSLVFAVGQIVNYRPHLVVVGLAVLVESEHFVFYSQGQIDKNLNSYVVSAYFWRLLLQNIDQLSPQQVSEAPACAFDLGRRDQFFFALILFW